MAGKVSELAEGDFTQIRECAEYFCRVAKGAEMGDSEAMQVADGVKGFTYREPWGVCCRNHSLELSDCLDRLVHVPGVAFR